MDAGSTDAEVSTRSQHAVTARSHSTRSPHTVTARSHSRCHGMDITPHLEAVRRLVQEAGHHPVLDLVVRD